MLQEMTLVQGNGYARLMNGGSESLAVAMRRYRDARLAAQLGRLVSRLTGRSQRLQDLDALRAEGRLEAGHEAGLKTVPIRSIRGSEGRSKDFDAEFRPVTRHTQGRWVGIAAATARGLALPPVELIQVGETYYVRDGHHRISVAKAFGQEEIEAEVTVLEVE